MLLSTLLNLSTSPLNSGSLSAIVPSSSNVARGLLTDLYKIPQHCCLHARILSDSIPVRGLPEKVELEVVVLLQERLVLVCKQVEAAVAVVALNND